MNKSVIAVYSGDDIEFFGTVDEVADFEGIKPESVRFYATPHGRSKSKGKEYVRVTVDDYFPLESLR